MFSSADEMAYLADDLAGLGDDLDDLARCAENARAGQPPPRITPNQVALKDIVNDATNFGRTRLSVDYAETVLEWADEVSYPLGNRSSYATSADPATEGNHWVRGPHIHLRGAGRRGHVPVGPGVEPR